MLSDAAIPCRLTAAVLDKVAGRYQHLQMLFHRVAVCAGHIDNLAVGNPPMRLRQFGNLHRKFGQPLDHQPFAGDLRFKPYLLLTQRLEEIVNLRHPFARFAANIHFHTHKYPYPFRSSARWL
jgi:hypothetical protein